MALTGDKIKAALSKLASSDDFATALAEVIVKNLEVEVVVNIPAGTVAVGSGGAAAPNPADIGCSVKVGIK